MSTTSVSPSHVPLSSLSIDQVNARKTNIEPSPAFVMNVRTIGIKVPLLVRVNGTGYKVADGGKRLRTLHAIRDAKQDIKGVPVTDDYPVLVSIENATDEAARDASLALNVFREPMHPVDEYETVSALIAGGDTVEAIAARYGSTVKEVNQALALGALSPKIRDAWRTGEIKAETAQAFTLLAEHADQDKLFTRLAKDRSLTAHAVRRELKADDREIGRLVAFVGDETCAAAGLRITRDLFKPTSAIVAEADVPKLKALADERLNAECERLVADGWQWAVRRPENLHYVPRDHVKPQFTAEEKKRADEIEKKLDPDDDDGESIDWRESEKLEAELGAIKETAELRSTTQKFRKSHGCFVSVDDEGKLDIDYGAKELPRAVSTASTAGTGAASEAVTRAKAKKKKDGGPISNALNQRLSEQLTAAAEEVMRRSPHVAAAAIIAGSLAGEKFVDIRVTGLAEKQRRSFQRVSFTNTFAAMLAANDGKIELELAALAARALDFQEHNAETAPMKRKETAAICNALDPKEMLAAIRKRWDAKDYFAGVSAALRVKAATEALGEDIASRTVAKMKKDEATKWCATNIPPTGWLPPEIRTAHYTAPKASAAKATASKAKKPAKKAAKRKAA